jgi:1-acyl-sn-glycerol-3-phosphate acyltransferase
MVLLRSALFSVLYPLYNLAWFLFGLPGLLMRPQEILTIYASPWARANVWLLRVVCGVETEYRGLENIPSGGAIIAAKHQSALDAFAMATVTPDFSFILKRELMWIPFLGWYLARAGQIPINRGKRSEALLLMRERAREETARGRKIIIFPEGTRRAIGAEPAYKFGVALLYETTGAPVVPVAVNAGLFWQKGKFLKRPGRAVISVLPPIPAGLPKEEMFQRLQEIVEAETAALVAEGRASAASASA